ncbi:glutamine synthetase/guanido kinase [Imleria badia]|nr:glutamine synthetase/guanido kinase [Imleria badia]
MSPTPVIESAPQNVPPRKSYEDFASVFDAHGVRYVRIQWVDLNNQVRCRFLPVSHFRKLLESERPGVTLTKAALGIVVLQLASGFSAVGEHIYVIDFSSFRLCSYAPGHAVFFGFFQEQVSVPRPSGPSFAVPLCPRTVLLRLLRYAAEELGIQFLVGAEAEFTLLKSANPLVPVNDHQWSTTLALTTGTTETRVLEEIADAIQADGIELEMYHSEGAPGQYEVVTGPMSPLEAADALVHTRETIYNIASKHGLKATFAPRLALDSAGSGAHMHVSVRGKRSGTSASELLTPVESAFLAGLMHHLPSVIAFTLPLSASYARMLDGIWSGGTWVCWGVDNREAPVRLTKASSPSSRNFEIRPIDGTSNPHLAVAGVLACGILGVRDDLLLTVKNCDLPRTAAEMTVKEREALGITKRLPLNISEARRYLAADDTIKDILGSELVESFIRVNEMLAKVIDRREGEWESSAVARLVENY